MKQDNKKKLYESIMASVAKEVKKALNEDYWDDDDEEEYITYNDIIDAVEGEDYQQIIDDDGEHIADWILDRIMYPANGYNCASACVEIAERLLNGESVKKLRRELGKIEI